MERTIPEGGNFPTKPKQSLVNLSINCFKITPIKGFIYSY